METSVINATATNGASVEIATITHDGHAYTNHGAILDLDGGHVWAYVSEDIPPKTGPGYGPINRQYAYRGDLTNFQGQKIGTWVHVSTWKRHGSWDTYTMRQIEATIDGDPRTWRGRYGSDWSQLVHLRPAKH